MVRSFLGLSSYRFYHLVAAVYPLCFPQEADTVHSLKTNIYGGERMKVLFNLKIKGYTFTLRPTENLLK
jgi:hypothetical protein